MKVVIVIPAYNERESAGRMVETLSKIFARIKNHTMQVLYVDGNSPDGTADVIRAKQAHFPWLHLLVETKKEGIGRAYAKGMHYAMHNLKADYLMEMDGDFQHRPEDIPALVAQIDNGYDFIIGSRYIKGGSIPKQWEPKRIFLSLVGNLVARVLLLLPTIHDVTGGFRLTRVKGFMADFNFDRLLSRNFAYKLHILYYMVSRGAKTIEVPITFQHRSSGESKLIKNEIPEMLKVIFKLQSHNRALHRFIKFGITGALGLTWQTLIFEFVGLRAKLLPAQTANLVGGEVAIISNFILNNTWTFKEHQIRGKSQFRNFVKFNLSSFIALGIQTAIIWLVKLRFPSNDNILRLAYAGALVLVLIINFTVYNLFIWKTHKKA